MKRFIIGDIHGCYIELQELLEKAGLSSGDEIIAIGDIVDRGPDSPWALNFFHTQSNARLLMGNHERKHIRSFKGEIQPALSQLITQRQFGKNKYYEAVSYMESFPLYLELPEAIIVHAFFEPDIPLTSQKEVVLAGTLSGKKYLRNRYNRPWYELYNNDKPIIAGHHNYSGKGVPFIHQDRVFCIDTGCCYGKTLTGLILPDFSIVSVKSRKDYWREIKKGGENEYI